MIRIGDVIFRERTEKSMTQQQLASFLSVTKATISKWEKGLSYPDITLLPVIASFFSISVDELLDAKPVMDKESIREWYVHFAERFSKEPFDTVYEELAHMMKLYYDDDNFLLQMSILLLNHAQLAVQSGDIFKVVIETLKRVEDITKDLWIQRQANTIIATTSLFNGDPVVALERLKGSVLPTLGEEMTLAQAHEALGEEAEAKRVLQVMMYQHILGLVGSSPFYLKLTLKDNKQFLETIKRIEGIINLFEIDQLHPNVSLQFYYAVAQHATDLEDEQLCQTYLTRYTERVMNDLFPIRLKGDAYFNLLDSWFDTLDLGPAALREENLIKRSIIESLNHPAFQQYENTIWFIDLKKKLQFQLGGSDE